MVEEKKIDPGAPQTAKPVEGELHPVDQQTFANHPSLLWETWMRLHPTHINHTTPHFGPMLYHLIRMQGGSNVIEIGLAQGYSSWFMTQAVHDNNIRYGMTGKYVGIDIADKSYYLDDWKAQGLPVEFWCMSSLDVTPEMIQRVFPAGIDVLYQDGWHNTKHCLRELELYYPFVKGKGDGYIVMHDVYSWCEEYFQIISNDPRWQFEYIRFLNNYGLAICRKMDGYDYNKVFWPDGDQPEEQGFVL